VYFDDKLLPWRKIQGVLQYEKYVDVSGGEVFRVPTNIESKEAEIVVKDGEKKLKRLKLKDVPVGQ
jgi:hypothetical protein